MDAALAGNLAEAYRCAWTMISLIHDIEFHEQLALGLAAVMDRVVWMERSCSSRRAA